MPAFSPGLCAVTYAATTRPEGALPTWSSTQVTPSSGRWNRLCCWKLIAAATIAATVTMTRRALASCCFSSLIPPTADTPPSKFSARGGPPEESDFLLILNDLYYRGEQVL